MEKVQREDKICNLPALTEQSYLRISEFHKLLAAGPQVLKGNDRNHHFLQADSAVDIVFSAAFDLDAGGVLWSVSLDRCSIQYP